MIRMRTAAGYEFCHEFLPLQGVSQQTHTPAHTLSKTKMKLKLNVMGIWDWNLALFCACHGLKMVRCQRWLTHVQYHSEDLRTTALHVIFYRNTYPCYYMRGTRSHAEWIMRVQIVSTLYQNVMHGKEKVSNGKRETEDERERQNGRSSFEMEIKFSRETFHKNCEHAKALTQSTEHWVK